jgi:hypothetical protein
MEFMNGLQWQTIRASRLSKRMVFPKEFVILRQNEFKDLAALTLA